MFWCVSSKRNSIQHALPAKSHKSLRRAASFHNSDAAANHLSGPRPQQIQDQLEKTMRQTLHIFKKDIRHLRFDIILFLALTTFYALAELHWGNRLEARWLLLVSAVLLIPRLIHAELIPQ